MHKSIHLIMLCSVSLMLSGCPLIETISYVPNTHQGNYLSEAEVAQIKLGMSKEQITFILGNSVMDNFFDDQKGIYIFRIEHKNRLLTEERLILRFDASQKLVGIDTNMPILKKDLNGLPVTE